MKRWYLLAVIILLLVGCRSTIPNHSTEQPVQSPTLTLSPTVPLVTETPAPPSPTVTPQPPTETATVIPPTETPLQACVILIYAEYAQFEIIGPSRQRVLVDVHDPQKLSSPAVDSDVLLTTHTHWDHINEDFQSSFPGLQLFVQAGMLEAPGAIIQGIASAHNQGDALQPEGGSNYIYLIETGGLRIAHFGDIGQKVLTEEQLTVLGQVDIAISQLNNPYSEMNVENAKGINLMTQVQPRLLIPTHLNLDTVKLATAQWPGFYTDATSVQICESDLSWEGTQILLMGQAVDTMVKYVNLTKWENSE